MDRGTWQATVHGVAKSQTQLTIKQSTAQHKGIRTQALLETVAILPLGYLEIYIKKHQIPMPILVPLYPTQIIMHAFKNLP